MSEYETIQAELTEVKDMLKSLIRQRTPEPPEWIGADETCEMLHIAKNTLSSYRHKRIIDFQGPRPYRYSRRSIDRILEERTIRSA